MKSIKFKYKNSVRLFTDEITYLKPRYNTLIINDCYVKFASRKALMYALYMIIVASIRPQYKLIIDMQNVFLSLVIYPEK